MKKRSRSVKAASDKTKHAKKRKAASELGVEIRLTPECLAFNPIGWKDGLVSNCDIDIDDMTGAHTLIVRNIRAHRVGGIYYIEEIEDVDRAGTWREEPEGVRDD